MIKVMLIGNVGKDPQTGQAKGVSYCSFSVAINESYKDKEGNWQTNTEWFDCVCWRNTAEYASNNLKKGMKVYLEGKPKKRSWKDEETGKTMYATDFLIEKIEILEKRENPSTQQDKEEGDLPF